jgi:hypothetical protein
MAWGDLDRRGEGRLPLRVISQDGDGCADGAHAFLVSQVTPR